MSGEHCPLLGSTLPAYETFVAQWQVMATSPNHPQLAPFIQEGLSWATSYHKRMQANKAYLFAMCRSSITLQCLEANFTLSNLKVVDPSIHFSWMKAYHTKYPTSNLLPTPEPAQPNAFMTLASWYGLPNMQIAPSTKEQEDSGKQSVKDEFASYTGTISYRKANVLAFWELERLRYPTIFWMAMDYLPIQASTVPCERVFSSSAETDSKKQNRISPALMEALQMVKFWLKKDRLDFTRQWITLEKDMVYDEDTEDALARLATAEGSLNDAMVQAINAIALAEGDTVPNHVQLYQL
ncbi:hypothetical protein SCLCIDRAFT_122301 [Scleroderma citrinum Foug A]|uniref:HAT C-terminal dimerisation domain-containing protein n=1 Tax=Scleroderma citrinum Foug A TaxID=1036808 RepID=A0A0C3A8Z9_9AGAM|nr:hypothetical protein SCLCIDRAFT_122301 [Scleroderma citrinum Foug A]